MLGAFYKQECRPTPYTGFACCCVAVTPAWDGELATETQVDSGSLPEGQPEGQGLTSRTGCLEDGRGRACEWALGVIW